MQYTTLAHLIDEEFLREAFGHIRKKAAAGVDGVAAKAYAKDLDANIAELYQRMRSGRYTAPPVRRGWLEKDDGNQRPIGLPALEDKVLQRAVTMLLEAIYEQVFYACSHGFRRKKSAHNALREIRENCTRMGIRWILDVDIKGYFDSIRRDILRAFLRKKMNDGTIIRFIGKWLNAGVMEEGRWTSSETGTPQGGVISPMLSNVFLHYVLDEWFEQEVKPRMKERCFLSRFADDFVMGFELESDARRVMEVLPKRFDRFGLTIHPTKTKLIEFGRPPRKQTSGKGKGTFDFLGFTHYWARSLQAILDYQTEDQTEEAACRGQSHLGLVQVESTYADKGAVQDLVSKTAGALPVLRHTRKLQVDGGVLRVHRKGLEATAGTSASERQRQLGNV